MSLEHSTGLRLTFFSQVVTEKDPMGPSKDRPLPHILCFSSSLKYLDKVPEAHFLSCFTGAKTPTYWKTVYLLIMSTCWPWPRPTGAWGLTKLTPMTPPCYPTVNPENCAQAAHIARTPLLHLALKNKVTVGSRDPTPGHTCRENYN